MRRLAYATILFGAIHLLAAIAAEATGRIYLGPPIRFRPAMVNLNVVWSFTKTESPSLFRLDTQLMGGVWIVGGIVILRLVRRQDTLDPFSNRFVGKESIGDLERTLKAEEEKRRRRS